MRQDRVLFDDTLCGLKERNLPVDQLPAFEPAGPRRKIFFDPSKTRAAIVTCGGLCPGFNDVIRSLVLELNKSYGVRKGSRLLQRISRIHCQVRTPGARPDARQSGRNQRARRNDPRHLARRTGSRKRSSTVWRG